MALVVGRVLAALLLLCVLLQQCHADSGTALEVLGLGPPLYQWWRYAPPTEGEVKRAFHGLSLQLHPDKQRGKDAERYMEVREAYDFLKGSGAEADERRRAASERYRDRGAALASAIELLRATVLDPIELLRREAVLLWRQPLHTLGRWKDNLGNAKPRQWVLWLLQLWIGWQGLALSCHLLSVRLRGLVWRTETGTEGMRTRQRAALEQRHLLLRKPHEAR
ncbi:hypothetical protein B484DRAFT_442228 [Ochromonadaceae sp. CCMP2298]|nr:hypothetical protein B484DRAFT_442228 [Ochromonadaceae sp. CCMP2298]